MKDITRKFYHFLAYYEDCLSEHEGKIMKSAKIRAELSLRSVTEVIEDLVMAKTAQYRQFINYENVSAISPESLVSQYQGLFGVDVVVAALARLKKN